MERHQFVLILLAEVCPLSSGRCGKVIRMGLRFTDDICPWDQVTR